MLPELLKSLDLNEVPAYLLIFTGVSLLMMWRLEAMLDHGLEGTALGTLVMPYCSGLGNLVFVGLMISHDGAPGEVLTNCLVNNVTNLTLLLGLPALCWGLTVLPARARQAQQGGFLAGDNAFFWTSGSGGWYRQLKAGSTGVVRRSPGQRSDTPGAGYSCRCVKD